MIFYFFYAIDSLGWIQEASAKTEKKQPQETFTEKPLQTEILGRKHRFNGYLFLTLNKK